MHVLYVCVVCSWTLSHLVQYIKHVSCLQTTDFQEYVCIIILLCIYVCVYVHADVQACMCLCMGGSVHEHEILLAFHPCTYHT